MSTSWHWNSTLFWERQRTIPADAFRIRPGLLKVCAALSLDGRGRLLDVGW